MDGGVEFEEIVRRGHEAPLEADSGDASEEELAEATCLRDLTEDRLDRFLPKASVQNCVACFGRA